MTGLVVVPSYSPETVVLYDNRVYEQVTGRVLCYLRSLPHNRKPKIKKLLMEYNVTAGLAKLFFGIENKFDFPERFFVEETVPLKVKFKSGFYDVEVRRVVVGKGFLPYLLKSERRVLVSKDLVSGLYIDFPETKRYRDYQYFGVVDVTDYFVGLFREVAGRVGSFEDFDAFIGDWASRLMDEYF